MHTPEIKFLYCKATRFNAILESHLFKKHETSLEGKFKKSELQSQFQFFRVFVR